MCSFKNLNKLRKPGKNFEKTSGNPVLYTVFYLNLNFKLKIDPKTSGHPVVFILFKHHFNYQITSFWWIKNRVTIKTKPGSYSAEIL